MNDNNDQVIVGIIPKKIYVMNEWYVYCIHYLH